MPHAPPPASVVSIHVVARHGGSHCEVAEVTAVAGQGLVGDRQYIETPDANKLSKRQLTLIESEVIEAFNDEFFAAMSPGDFRRQIVTRGVRLNDLVGREFTIGGVRVRGTMLCEPCRHLAQLTCRQVLFGLQGRGGLCAQILTSGTIRTGDAILVDSP